MIPIYTVCTGPNYNASHGNRLLRELKKTNLDFKLYCYSDLDGFDSEIEVIPLIKDQDKRQWYKIDLFKTIPDGLAMMMDLDWTFIQDPTDILNCKVEHGQFMAPYRWWTEYTGGYKINGGLYKFYAQEQRHIYEAFYSDPDKWMSYYINKGVAQPPVNGEQNFVEDHLAGEIVFFEPWESIGRYPLDEWHFKEYNILYPEEYFYIDQFNPKIKMVHSIL